MKPTLSIIVPVYNTARYLEDCFTSLVNQNIENIEIIVVNDGSTDHSSDIIEKYRQKYNYFHVINQENQGQGAARNAGIKTAKGEYLYFMDSDDQLELGKLKEVLQQAITHKLDAVFFDGSSFLDEGFTSHSELSRSETKYSRTKSYGIFMSGEELMAALSADEKFIISPCLYLFKRQILLDNGVFFPERIVHEDEYFTTVLTTYLGPCMHVNEKVFARRIRANSTMTASNHETRFLGYSFVLKKLDEVIDEHRFLTKEGKKAFKKKMAQTYHSTVLDFQQVANNKENQKIHAKNIQIAKKHRYFRLKTLVFHILIKNKKIYDILYNKNR